MSIVLTQEKSEELAQYIELMKLYAVQIDLDYAKELVKQFRDQASWQQSASVINAGHNAKKDLLLFTQADALSALVKYIELLQECSELKKGIQEDSAHQDEISKLFL